MVFIVNKMIKSLKSINQRKHLQYQMQVMEKSSIKHLHIQATQWQFLSSKVKMSKGKVNIKS